MRGHAELGDALSLQQVGQRLARFLLVQARDHGSRTEAGIEVDVTVSNEELVREVVSRTFTRLERDGLIGYAAGAKNGKRRRLLIADEAALARYAGQEEDS